MNDYKKLLDDTEVNKQHHLFMNRDAWLMLISSSIIVWDIVIWLCM